MVTQAGLFESCSMYRSAVFSQCRRYRYTLSRTWDVGLGIVNFLMLNPSTADETQDDPTIARQIVRARILGYGGLVITNLFAWRSTDPAVLPLIEEPVGPLNDEVISLTARSSQMVICGWGNHGSLNSRSAHVLKLLAGVQLFALKVNETGEPQHPLYIGYKTQPELFHAA